MTTVARLCLGLALTTVPDRVVSVASGRPATSLEIRLARVLGVRHLAEAAGLQLHPALARAVRALDALHATSMVALAVGLPAHRRLAAANAVVATALAAGTRP